MTKPTLSPTAQDYKALALTRVREILVLKQDAKGRNAMRRCEALLAAATTDGELLTAMIEGKLLMTADVERNKQRRGRRP